MKDYEILENIVKDSSVSLERRVKKLLRLIGLTQSNIGYDYINEAILLATKDRSYLHNITKKLYPTIAQKFETTPDRVERAIRHEIYNFFKISTKNERKIKSNIFGVSIEKGKLTNSEFIASLVNFIEEALL